MNLRLSLNRKGPASAGPFTTAKAEINDVARLVNEHGCSPSDWSKITSTTGQGIETHAYRNVATGEVVELKSIADYSQGYRP